VEVEVEVEALFGPGATLSLSPPVLSTRAEFSLGILVSQTQVLKQTFYPDIGLCM
jgi:hypothetical protein